MIAHNKVMFIDDEEGVLVSWNRFLTEKGLDVLTAQDGESAIAELRHNPVDVVVSDLRMPNVDGLELLQWLRDRQPNTRFILLTGYGDEDVEKRARQLGAFEYLDKPVAPETLAAVITAALQMGLIRDESKEVVEVPEEPVEIAVAEPEAVVEEAPSRRGVLGVLETVGGLIAAPLMGLAFVVFFPVIALVALIKVLGEAVWELVTPARS